MENQNTKVTNAKTLNQSLIEVYNGVIDGTTPLPIAKQTANTAGKIIKNNMCRLEYNKYRNIDKEIDFWQE